MRNGAKKRDMIENFMSSLVAILFHYFTAHVCNTFMTHYAIHVNGFSRRDQARPLSRVPSTQRNSGSYQNDRADHKTTSSTSFCPMRPTIGDTYRDCVK